MKKFITLGTIILYCLNGFAQAGQPDPSFGVNGIVTANLGTPVSYTNTYPGYLVAAMPLQDGSIFMVLHSAGKTYIAKRLADGSPDISFATSGFSGPFDLNVLQATWQADGKILILYRIAMGDIGMARFKTTGNLDSTFGNNGIQSTNIRLLSAIAVQSDGKIVVAGQEFTGSSFFDYLIARFNSDGSPDYGFGSNGKQTVDLSDYDDATAIAIQSDGKIVLGGTATLTVNSLNIGNFGLVRFNNDGSIDNTFGTGGTVITQFDPGAECRITGVVIQGDGKIVAAGSTYLCDNTGCTNSRFALARYNPDGTLDNTFNATGLQSIAFSRSVSCAAVSLQSDGKIVAAGFAGGTTFDFAVARYNTDGSLDNTFDSDGYTITTLSSLTNGYDRLKLLAVQNDGKILIGTTIGSVDFGLARYNTNGSLDNTLNSSGILVDQVSFTYTYSTTRFTETGIQPDRKIIAGGVASAASNGVANFRIRYNNDGSPDSSFSGTGTIPGVTTSSVLLPDGKIVHLAGFGFARYNVDGTLDVSSQQVVIGDGANGTSVAVGTDGKVVVAGYAYVTTVRLGETFNSVQLAVARFNTDGTLDDSFGNVGTIVGHYDIATYSTEKGTAVGVQSDGSVIVSVNEDYPIRNPDPNGPTGITEVQLLHYSSNGNFDRVFGYFADTQNGGPIFIQSDDKILFGVNSQLVRYNADGSYDSTFTPAYISLSTLRQSDGKIVTGGPYFLARYNTDGTPDSSFGNNGKVDSVNYIINEIAIGNDKLAAAGYIQSGLNTTGVLGVYLLSNAPVFTCPAPVIISADKEKCSAVVNNIDPVTSNAAVNYTLTGATIRTGTGSAGGNTFNTGVTTVTYSLADDPSATCSFTVTVRDDEPPRMSGIFALPYVLWPVNHKMRPVYLFYLTKDNCGSSSCNISITANQNISGDWEVLSNHLIKLRAEREGGKERIYTVKVTCTDAAGNSSSQHIKIIVPKARGNENDNNIKKDGAPVFEYVEGLKAFPNPSNSYYNLQLNTGDFNEKISLRIYDLSGRIVEEKSGLSPGKFMTAGAALRPGMYIAEVRQGEKVQRIKLVKSGR